MTSNSRSLLQLIIVAAATVAGVFAFQWAYNEAAELSALFAGVTKVLAAIGLWYFVDLIFLQGVNTIEEITKGNAAIGLTVAGYFIMAGIILGYGV